MSAGKVLVVGAGMGGLTAALRLRQLGHEVCVLEARATPGGLASSFSVEGLTFDGGPYVLLDRPGLAWALARVGIDLDDRLPLVHLDEVYQVAFPDGTTLAFHHDLDRTASAFEHKWPGAGARYVRYVRESQRIYAGLQPLLTRDHGLRAILSTGAWRHAPFLLRSLGAVLASAGLPQPLVDSLAIWTHVAGQELAAAPSPLGFVPALIHSVGAYVPKDGVGAIPRLVAAAATAAGVELRCQARVRRITEAHGRATGLELDDGAVLTASAVLSNYNGVGTHVELVKSTPAAARERLTALPLQSPGACAYLAVRGTPRPPYLRFYLPDGERCRLFVQPGVVLPDCAAGGEYPARLIAPMDHARARADGSDGQQRYLERLVEEPWWRTGLDGVRVVASRTPRLWGEQYHLYKDSMNPVMTARLMRAGRLPQKSPHLSRLYLAGSSTHPGQWVSFCAISGVLAAERLHRELA